ncbi:lysozyme-like domain-containing protein [Blakeslea trispora]|nr:lysozyme-like domain-containing protein [Blakeslea trispora]
MVQLLAFPIFFALGVLALPAKHEVKRNTANAYCQNDFEATDAICSKFTFITNNTSANDGCVSPKNGTTFYSLTGLPKISKIDDNTIKIASMITNVFEDGTPNFSYAYCENIKDSRGFTAGYAGFTTATGDAEIVIQKYALKSPINLLLPYLPRIKQIGLLPHCDRQSRGTVLGLFNYCAAWKHEACRSNSKFAKMQIDWVYKNYMLPSTRYAAQNGVTSPLGRAIFYDTIIQHGYQYVEPDINIVRIITLTGPRLDTESEKEYLTRFLTTRRQLQCCYPDDVWPESASRSKDLQNLVDEYDRYKDLQAPIELKEFGVNVTGKSNLHRDEKHCKGKYSLFDLPWDFI